MKRLVMPAAAALAVAAVVSVALTLPPRRLTLANPFDRSIPGEFHIHTARSDGQGTPADVADAAARAGLKFVILTDHGDGTRKPDAPFYRSGVLVLDGVEISTTGGHYAVFDMPAAPYPLGGDPRDVVEDVKRLGGFGAAAHPDSPKGDLRWRSWSAPFDGIEVVNLDTSWRQWAARPSRFERLRLARVLFSYPIRPAESIASLVSPSGSLQQWAAAASRRRVVTLGGGDAHARMALRETEPLSIPLPSYEASFRTLSIHVRPDRPLSGDAAADAAVVSRAIREGHLYTSVDGVAGPPAFELSAAGAHNVVHEGDEIAAGEPLTLHVRSNAPPQFTTTVRNGAEIVAADRHEDDFTVGVPAGAGVYWVEIRGAGAYATVPWVTSNPIYVRDLSADPKPLPPAPTLVSQPLFDGRSTDIWHVEKSAGSVGALDVAPQAAGLTALRLRFGIGGSTTPDEGATEEYVALAVETRGGVASNDRVSFTTRAERPMRISVQLRAGRKRWQRSVYVDTFDRDRTLMFDQFLPVGDAGAKPPLAAIESILFVVDETNTKPGTSGRLWIERPAIQH